MELRLLALGIGLLIFCTVFTFGFLSSMKLEKSLRDTRIEISSLTRFFDIAGVPLSVFWFLMFAFTMYLPTRATDDWLLPILFLAVSIQFGFPKGALVRPGLTGDGLFYMGTLYPWNYFTTFQIVDDKRVRLYYKSPFLGLKSLKINIPANTMEQFISRLTVNGISVKREI